MSTADARFLCDIAATLRGMIKKTPLSKRLFLSVYTLQSFMFI
jgi:hypothetical protein